MTVPNRISIITLGVDDLARSTVFYESLGSTKSSAFDRTEANAHLHLRERERPSPAYALAQTGRVRRAQVMNE